MNIEEALKTAKEIFSQIVEIRSLHFSFKVNDNDSVQSSVTVFYRTEQEESNITIHEYSGIDYDILIVKAETELKSIAWKNLPKTELIVKP
jgi:hypothetical protein